jgi:CBS domain-containing protein
MVHKGIGCLPVVEGTQLVGVVTKTDLLRCLHSLSS